MASLALKCEKLQKEFRDELRAIADWWVAHTIDHEHDGFYGEVGVDNAPVKNAGKGIILNTRILWFFSEVAMEIDNPTYRECAERAYNYLVKYFFDTEHGGVYWELDAAGNPVNTKKQVYAQAFSIYALGAYYQLTQDPQALAHAMSCFELLEAKAVDRERDGYLEAFTRSWGAIEDLRLSEVDLNYPKSQNTHLHVMEAYTRLHVIQPAPAVKAALRYNIELFDKYMINRSNHHLRMFLDMDWKDFSPGFTYGHDIEASWLIAKALESLGDKRYAEQLTPTLIKIAEVTLNEAIGVHGQVMNSYDYATKQVNAESVWWVQAEALVGFLYAYVTTHEARYFTAAENVWAFTKEQQIDRKNGEWFWLAEITNSNAEPHYKVGFWKCPYHNGRAMMEASRYLDKLTQVV